MEVLIVGLVSGVISGILANFLFKDFVLGRKPVITICPNLIKTFNSKGIPAIRAKVINKGKREVIDLKTTLYGVKYFGSEKKLKSLYDLDSDDLHFLPAYPHPQEDNCYRPVYKMKSKDIHETIIEYDALCLFVKGMDSTTGAFYTNFIEFEKSVLLDNRHNFQAGMREGTEERNDVVAPKNPSKREEMIENLMSCPFVVDYKQNK